MNVVINGRRHEVADRTTLAAALQEHGVPDRGVAVAVDGAVVPRDAWTRTPLEPEAGIEILTAVQGG